MRGASQAAGPGNDRGIEIIDRLTAMKPYTGRLSPCLLFICIVFRGKFTVANVSDNRQIADCSSWLRLLSCSNLDFYH